MASKGQKFNKYSEEFKDEILKFISKDLENSNYLHLIYSFYEISRGVFYFGETNIDCY